MNSRTSQRTVYLVTAAIVASMVGGFALADMTLGGTNSSYQGSQTTTVSHVSGLTWLYTNISSVAGTTAVPNPCKLLATACDAATTGYTVCAGSFNTSFCKPSDFVEQVTILVSTLASFPPNTGSFPTDIVALTVYVTGIPVGSTQGTFVGPTCYFVEFGQPTTAENIVLDFDVGSTPTGPGAVTAVSVLATTATP